MTDPADVHQTEHAPPPKGAEEGLPPAVAPTDPVSPATHIVGGTYADAGDLAAARRSQARKDQLERPPGQDADGAQSSGFADARGREGPASVAGGR